VSTSTANTEPTTLKKQRPLLEKAMPIAHYHKREAFVGRIGRQLALVIQADPHATEDEKTKAAQLMANAVDIKKRLWKVNGSRVKQVPKDEEEKWAWLVAAWYR
jgi:hypothetical protein